MGDVAVAPFINDQVSSAPRAGVAGLQSLEPNALGFGFFVARCADMERAAKIGARRTRGSRWVYVRDDAPFRGAGPPGATQRELMALGLSSLGRLESRVLPTLQAVRAALAALAGREKWAKPDEEAFFAGEKELAARIRALFGDISTDRVASLLVTCPSEAAEDGSFMLSLAEKGVEAVRINCAHDDADKWARMIEHVHAAGERTGRRMRIFMDLAGPKVRTGEFCALHHDKRVQIDDLIALVAPGKLDRPGKKDAAFAVECTLTEALDASTPGDRLSIDDGKAEARIERVEDDFVIARVTRCDAEGYKLKSEKGLNFPDAELAIPALTAKDRADLRFVMASRTTPKLRSDWW